MSAKPGSVEYRREKRLQTCVHFTGVQNKTCKLGHAYTRPLPCLAPFTPDQKRGECADLRLYTLEEFEAEEKAFHERFEFYRTARARIAAKISSGGGAVGVIECPKCKGRLHYSRAASNGHVWGKCDTPHCIAWME